jgi:hypothetical protein
VVNPSHLDKKKLVRLERLARKQRDWKIRGLLHLTMAGLERFELSVRVLETRGLPLTDSPKQPYFSLLVSL